MDGRLKKKAQWKFIREFIGFLVSAAILLFLFSLMFRNVRYNWQWYRVPRYLFRFKDGAFSVGPLITGLGMTLRISFLSLILALFFGMASAYLRLSGGKVAPLIGTIYVEAVRNTPLLIQLFFIYFVFAPVFGIGSQFSAILALSLFEGAYASEIIRGGIMAVDKGQWEAAWSLGLKSSALYRDIIFPQAFRTVIPSLAGQAVSTVKDSALVSTIAIYDLTMRGREIISETFLTFEIWFTLAGIYLIITLGLSICIHLMDRLLLSRG